MAHADDVGATGGGDVAALSHAAFVQAPIPHCYVGADGRLLLVNAAFGRLLGLDPDELAGRRLGELIEEGPASLTGAPDGERWGGRYELVFRGSRSSVPVVVDLFPLEGLAAPSYAMTVHDPGDTRDVAERLEAQQAFFRGLNRRAWDVALVIDAEGTVVYASPSAKDLFGYDPVEVVARSGFDFIHEDDQARSAAALGTVLTETDTIRETVRVRDAEGRWRWAEASVTNCLHDPDIGGIVINLRDITGEMESHLALRESEARHRAITETAQEGILALAPDGSTLFANQKVADLVGHSLEVVYAQGLWGLLSDEMAAGLRARLQSRAETGAERYELPYLHHDGNQRVLSISASPLPMPDGTTGSLAMIADVTSERNAVRELRRQALHDPLTGLPNRSLFTDRLTMAAARQSRATAGSLAVLFLDLDDFKQVNDNYGHATGDVLLREAADRFSAVLRQSDTLARLGGDEFVVICEETGAEEAQHVARRLVESLQAPFVIAGAEHRVSASVGVALSPPGSPEELLALADSAMYAAKNRAKGSVVVHDRTLVAASRRQTQLSSELGVAMEEGRLFVEYQPVVALRDGSVQGIEAVVRWQHPTRGRLRAFDVVTAARSAGLEVELQRFVLRTAGREIGRLVRSGALPDDCYLGVYAYSRDPVLHQGDELVAELTEQGWLPGRLMLRMSESALVEDPDRAINRAREAANLGGCIAVGDVGSGSGSLAWLHRIPLHLVKVDRSYVVGLGSNPECSRMVRSVAALASAMGARTVAEGVETAEQATLLAELGCDLAQGSFWSGPVAAKELGRFRATMSHARSRRGDNPA